MEQPVYLFRVQSEAPSLEITDDNVPPWHWCLNPKLRFKFNRCLSLCTNKLLTLASLLSSFKISIVLPFKFYLYISASHFITK